MSANLEADRDPVDVQLEAARAYVATHHRYMATFAKHRILGWEPSGQADAPGEVVATYNAMRAAFVRLCIVTEGEPPPENWADPGVINRYAQQ